jgi:outer membrane protein assembly factor BamB
VKWTNPNISAEPIIGSDGTLYSTIPSPTPLFGIPGLYVLEAWDSNGNSLWTLPSIVGDFAGPVFGCDGNVHFVGTALPDPTGKNKISAFTIDSHGNVLGSIPTEADIFDPKGGAACVGLVVADDQVIASISNDPSFESLELVAFKNDVLAWRTAVSLPPFTTSSSGLVFTRLLDASTLSAIAPDGGPAWTSNIGPFGDVYGDPIITSTDALYVSNATFTAIDAIRISDGALLWQNNNVPKSTPVALANGTLYLSTGADLYALDLATQATHVVFKDLPGTIVVDASNVVYVWNASGTLTAVNPDGSILFQAQYPATSQTQGRLIELGDHVLYVPSAGGLTAIGP